ncbi:S8 family serine peptidase [Streptomyces sp. S6]
MSVLPGPVPSASAAPSGSAAWRAGRSGPVQGTRTVTLLTGDQVTLAGDTVSVTPGKGRDGIAFTQYTDAGRRYVIPDDALGLVGAGTVDRRLFDVSGLVEGGYEGPAPLIVEARQGVSQVLGARVTRTFPELGLAAVRPGGGGALWEGLAADGVKVWLDAKVQVSDDVSVKQIGAPAAWQAGYTGTGVTVAVLDTGVDDTHPDLAARVVGKENFTAAPDTTDLVGHGTHVASILAGNGAASGGRYTGVAPGASLLIGKVCADRGCEESDILAGMEWAAPRARVVNMSLGGPDAPGTDPLEEAVGTLSAKYGTLFAVSAGNTGQDEAVESPASADAALAVGAVDARDALAEFSSRGPRVGDGAVKPDITAPGSAIVAARSKDSPLEPLDDAPRYAALSGTSMATPHVAGAAALLAQQHPDWTGARLKEALMGTARPNPALGLFAQGAGRVDVARAVGQGGVTVSPPSLSLGTASWPHDDDRPVTRTLTYRNDGPGDITLDLTTTASASGTSPAGSASAPGTFSTAPDTAASASGTPLAGTAPAPRTSSTAPGTPASAPGVFTVTPTHLTVPAGGAAEAVLTADTRVDSPTGVLSGAVTATSGTTALRSVFTLTKEHETHPLTVKVLDRKGQPAAGSLVTVLDIDRDEGEYLFAPDGTGTTRVRPGRHHLDVHIVTEAADGTFDHTLVAQPLLNVTGAETVVLDARKGRPLTVDPPRRGASSALAGVGLVRTTPSGGTVSSLVTAGSFARIRTADLGNGPLPAGAGAISATVRSSWAKLAADGTFTDSPYDYELAWVVRGRLPGGFHGRARPSDLAKVTHVLYNDRADTSVGSLWTYALPAEGGSAPSPNIKFTAAGKRTVYYSARDVGWTFVFNRFNALGQGAFQQWAAPVAFEAGRTAELRWGNGPLGPSLADQRGRVFGSVRRRGDTMMFNLPPFADQDPGHTGFSSADKGSTRLYRGERLLADVPHPFYDSQGPVPAADQPYRLETWVDRGGQGYLTSTSVRAVWTFRSAHTPSDTWTSLPVTAIRFTPGLRPDNSARAGHRLTLPITLQRQPGTPSPSVRTLTVEVSYDDGTTWTSVGVHRTTDPARWRADLLSPRGEGYASLRAKLTDADGNAAEYTVIRAYRLR